MASLTPVVHNAEARTRRASIVIVEPDSALRRFIAESLESCGYRVFGFASSAELAVFLDRTDPSHEPGLVLLDIGIDGAEVPDLREVVGTILGRCPFIAITTFASEPNRLRALQLGACGVLDKPSDTAALRSLIDHIGLTA